MKPIDEVLKYSGQISLLYFSHREGSDEYLKQLFPTMETAHSLEEAVELYHHHEKVRNRFFDLIVFDCESAIEACRNMVGWNGVEKVLLLSRQGCDNTPFLEIGISHIILRTLPFEAFSEVIFPICKDIYHKHRVQQYAHAYDRLKQEYEKNRLEWEEKHQQERQQLKYKSDFLAGMSHEIRTPMNAVMGLGHLLIQEELSETARDYVMKINASAEMLLGIVNDILDYSKIEAGKLKLENIEFDLNMVLDHVADMVGLSVHDKGLELIFEIEHQVRPNYIGDPTRISQIILNLMSNAVKFTDAGEVTLRVHTLASDANHQKLQFEVSDTGIGMSEEQSKNLFERYVQAEESTARKFGGTGLGLSICKELVELMGGRIWVKSEFGRGSTFGFVIELGISNPQERRVYHLIRKEMMQLKILIVDAHPHSAESLHQMIGYFHMGVDMAESKQTANEFLARKRYDTIFIDEQMADMCASPALFKENRPRIVLLESRMSNVKREICGDYRIDAVLYKPFNQQMVLNLFNTLYGEKETPSLRIKEHIGKNDLAAFAGSRILVAEDNTINQKVIRGLLSDTGIELELAGDGAEALRLLREKGPFELVLMDINMPVMNGYEASDAIRLTYDTTAMPIIALSADTMMEDIQKTKEHGMQEHLAKPIDVDALYDLLYRYLHEHHSNKNISVEVALKEDEIRFNRLTQIPKLDCETALERLGGSKELYVSLVEDFITLYKDAPERIRLFNTQKGYANAIRYIHDFKGVAGNIGSIVLFKLALALEEGYKNHEEDALNRLSDMLDTEMQSLIISLQDALSSECYDVKEERFDTEHYALLQKLLHAARMKKVLECVSIIGKFREIKWSKSQYEILNNVILSLKHYRFSEAVETLESLGIK